MTNAASFMKAVILVVLCVAAVNSQSRNNLDPATVESAEIQRSSTKPKSNGRTAEVIVQALGGATIIYCNTTNKCGGFSAVLSTIQRTEYPQYGGASVPVYDQGSMAGIPQSNGPVFPFVPKASGSSQSVNSSLPSGWRTYGSGRSTVIAPNGGMVNGDLRNGVILGQTSGRSAEDVSFSLLKQSTYLVSEGVTYRVNLNGNSCKKFKYSGYSTKSRSVENVEVFVCPNTGKTFSYAIAVSSGAQSDLYRSQLLNMVRDNLR